MVISITVENGSYISNQLVNTDYVVNINRVLNDTPYNYVLEMSNRNHLYTTRSDAIRVLNAMGANPRMLDTL